MDPKASMVFAVFPNFICEVTVESTEMDMRIDEGENEKTKKKEYTYLVRGEISLIRLQSTRRNDYHRPRERFRRVLNLCIQEAEKRSAKHRANVPRPPRF